MTAYKEYELKCCPVCGSDTLEEVYIDQYNHVVGCNECVTTKDIYEYTEEERINEEAAAGDAYLDYIRGK